MDDDGQSTVRAVSVRPGRWLVFTGNRLAVTLVLLAVMYLLISPVGHFLLDRFGGSLIERPAITSLLSSLLGGVFLLVSIVVSINSLFVSQEQVPLGEQYDRVRNAGEFRRELESLVSVPISPAEPDRFLQVLTSDLVSKAQELEAQLGDGGEDVRQYLSEAADQTQRLNQDLQAASTPLSLVLVTEDYDETRLTNGLRRIRSERGGIPEDADETIEEMLRVLDHLAAASEYFKTLYFGREFADLSNHLIFVSLPAIVVVSFALSHVSRLPDSQWIVSAIHVTALAPFVLLAAYVVRVAAVSKRTRSTGRFLVGTRRDVSWDRPGRDD